MKKGQEKKTDEKKIKENNKPVKEKKKKDVVLILLYVLLFIVAITFIVLKVRNWGVLKNDNKLVVELHDYFSTDSLENCGGLSNYSDKKTTYDDIDIASKLCIAYHKADLKSGKALTYDAGKVESTCEVDGMIFKTEDEKTTCPVMQIDRKVIDNSYKKIFGKEIEENDTFKTDGFHVCYLKGDSYYCGLSEVFTYTIGNDIAVYRSITKATKKDGVITITDNFIKIVNDDECYKNYVTQNVNGLCTRNYNSEKDMSYEFIDKYGITFKHIYKKAKDGTYYWVSSEPIADPNDY